MHYGFIVPYNFPNLFTDKDRGVTTLEKVVWKACQGRLAWEGRHCSMGGLPGNTLYQEHLLYFQTLLLLDLLYISDFGF